MDIFKNAAFPAMVSYTCICIMYSESGIINNPLDGTYIWIEA